MEFTGERYIPSVDGQIKYEHLHRYAVCFDFIVGKSVLDIASGEGYGSALLAKLAKSVVGVDISVDTVEYASQAYQTYENLKFMVGSCESIPLPEKSIDVVVSFETIEHHDQHERMMREIKRVLKPGGMLIISSPNRLTYSDEANYSNPFHVKELYYDELVNLIDKHFQYSKIYGQRLGIGSLIFPLEDAESKNFKAYTGDINNLSQKIRSLKSPLYFVAICCDNLEKIQTPVESLYIDKSDDLLKIFESKLDRSYREWQETQRLLQQAQTEWQEAQNIIQAMETSKFWKIRQFWFKLKQIFRFGY
ncbi:class I SAM-dependent methyltransferase [Dolichospermum sp. FACHB-1091]|uniref:class I SAM-dependent methyltransferase n=1 Tax=Dolichospermum sp. FACHB-1091 TaxID=2692798 RepID=UPI0016801FC5|nr:class I SAM-dependent methyltransferase [Dolichospermum sp. FACHB-1091]MBD2445205.1 class I SAM-dependent methyltransferase [Dolichospermum sp. FACHB-1091]